MLTVDERRSGEVDVATRVHQLLEPLAAAEGIELVDVRFSGAQLQVFVDRSGGLDLDTLSELSARISRLLDQHDPIPGRYALEVSSPGLERPLRTPEHFRRFVGATVTVRTRPDVPGERRVRGRLDAVDEDGIILVPSEGPGRGGARHIAYEDIERARTVFEWGPAPKPGTGPAKNQARKQAKKKVVS